MALCVSSTVYMLWSVQNSPVDRFCKRTFLNCVWNARMLWLVLLELIPLFKYTYIVYANPLFGNCCSIGAWRSCQLHRRLLVVVLYVTLHLYLSYQLMECTSRASGKHHIYPWLQQCHWGLSEALNATATAPVHVRSLRERTCYSCSLYAWCTLGNTPQYLIPIGKSLHYDVNHIPQFSTRALCYGP